MAAFYSEHDPFAAAWLRELIGEGLIPDGVVDERDIRTIAADDLRGYRSVHLFAGVGGWPLALRLAGWPDDRPVWSGSCPCQPFSPAGKRKGQGDDRHLWPAMFGLVRECRPVVTFGEQVPGAIGHGWLDGVCADLEGEGYAVGSLVLGAHSVGAPHIRQRLYWVADANGGERGFGAGRDQRANEGAAGVPLGDTGGPGLEGRGLSGRGRVGERLAPAPGSDVGWDAFDLIPCRDGKARRVEPGTFPLAHGIPRELGPLLAVLVGMGVDPGRAKRLVRNARGRLAKAGRNRVGRLRGYGNAICPQDGALFARAFLDVTGA
mgnify:FL=1